MPVETTIISLENIDQKVCAPPNVKLLEQASNKKYGIMNYMALSKNDVATQSEYKLILIFTI